MNWINAKKLPPPTPHGSSYNYSDFMVVRVKNQLFPTTARYECGRDSTPQWYCPLSDDVADVEWYADVIPKNVPSKKK